MRAEGDADQARGHVGDGHGDEERAQACGAACGAGADLVDERARAAEPGADEDAGLLGQLALQPSRQAGIVQRLRGGHQRHLRGAVVAADLLAVEHARRVEVGHLAGDPAGRPGRRRSGDAPHARVARHEAAPETSHVRAERRDGAEAGDDDAAPRPASLIGRTCRCGWWRPDRRPGQAARADLLGDRLGVVGRAEELCLGLRVVVRRSSSAQQASGLPSKA